MLLKRFDPSRVRFEGPVEPVGKYRTELRIRKLPRHDVLPPAVWPVGVRHVARGLLEIRHEPSTFKHLCQDVGNAFTRNVSSPKLGDRIVAVLAEHSCIQTFRPFEPRTRPALIVLRDLRDLVEKLVEEQATDRLFRPGVACEEGALDDFWKIGQHEDGAVDVSEVRCQRVLFLSGERFDARSEIRHTV